MSKLASRFIKPSVIQNHKDLGSSFSTLSSDYQDERNDIESGIEIIKYRLFLQIFNRIHKATVQDPSILNAAEDFLDYQALLNHNIPDNIWDPLNYLKMVIKWMLYRVT